MSFIDKVRGIFAAPPSPALVTAEGPVGAVLEQLRLVIDPEVGLDIVSMGLIRRVELEDERVEVGMVLTTAGCPVVGVLVEEIEEVLAELGLAAVVVIEADPPWSPDQMTPDAKAQLRL